MRHVSPIYFSHRIIALAPFCSLKGLDKFLKKITFCTVFGASGNEQTWRLTGPPLRGLLCGPVG